MNNQKGPQRQQPQAAPDIYPRIDVFVLPVPGATDQSMERRTFEAASYTVNVLPGGAIGQLVIFETRGDKKVFVLPLNRLGSLELTPSNLTLLS